MKDIKYDSSRPLMRLEKGDRAIITYRKSIIENDKDRERYANLPSGNYEAVCV